ncbi:hypothetical protein OSTOST_14919 [Ostertagia ostertagi]
MIGYLALLAVIASGVRSGAVGECRSECVELNLYKIVRVHLKDEEGKVPFKKRCPSNDPVPLMQLATCPQSFKKI